MNQNGYPQPMLLAMGAAQFPLTWIFLWAPSPEIGKIISADSNLVTTKQAMDGSKRWLFISLGAFIAGLIFQVMPMVLQLQGGMGWHIASADRRPHRRHFNPCENIIFSPMFLCGRSRDRMSQNLWRSPR